MNNEPSPVLVAPSAFSQNSFFQSTCIMPAEADFITQVAQRKRSNLDHATALCQTAGLWHLCSTLEAGRRQPSYHVLDEICNVSKSHKHTLFCTSRGSTSCLTHSSSRTFLGTQTVTPGDSPVPTQRVLVEHCEFSHAREQPAPVFIHTV